MSISNNNIMNEKQLYVSRYGIDSPNESYMVTDSILQIIKPKSIYKFTGQSLIETHHFPDEPQYIEISGMWCDPEEVSNPTNILGGIGLLKTFGEINIPINLGSKTNYDFFNCRTIYPDEEFVLDCEKSMGIFSMQIGPKYVQNYVMNKNLANGVYLEYHNTPHLYIKTNKNASGYLILGKKLLNGNLILSALTVPDNVAIYLPPNLIHNDCFLIGDYKVMYNFAETFSTVRLVDKTNTNNMTKVNLINLLI